MLLGVILSGLLVLGASEYPARDYHEPDSMSADRAPCGYWERIDDTTWRTEGGAMFTASTYDDEVQGYLIKQVVVPPRSDVGEKYAFDLYWTLESNCNDEAGGGGMQ